MWKVVFIACSLASPDCLQIEARERPFFDQQQCIYRVRLFHQVTGGGRLLAPTGYRFRAACEKVEGLET